MGFLIIRPGYLVDGYSGQSLTSAFPFNQGLCSWAPRISLPCWLLINELASCFPVLHLVSCSRAFSLHPKDREVRNFEMMLFRTKDQWFRKMALLERSEQDESCSSENKKNKTRENESRWTRKIFKILVTTTERLREARVLKRGKNGLGEIETFKNPSGFMNDKSKTSFSQTSKLFLGRRRI